MQINLNQYFGCDVVEELDGNMDVWGRGYALTFEGVKLVKFKVA